MPHLTFGKAVGTSEGNTEDSCEELWGDDDDELWTQASQMGMLDTPKAHSAAAHTTRESTPKGNGRIDQRGPVVEGMSPILKRKREPKTTEVPFESYRSKLDSGVTMCNSVTAKALPRGRPDNTSSVQSLSSGSKQVSKTFCRTDNNQTVHCTKPLGGGYGACSRERDKGSTATAPANKRNTSTDTAPRQSVVTRRDVVSRCQNVSSSAQRASLLDRSAPTPTGSTVTVVAATRPSAYLTKTVSSAATAGEKSSASCGTARAREGTSLHTSSQNKFNFRSIKRPQTPQPDTRTHSEPPVAKAKPSVANRFVTTDTPPGVDTGMQSSRPGSVQVQRGSLVSVPGNARLDFGHVPAANHSTHDSACRTSPGIQLRPVVSPGKQTTGELKAKCLVSLGSAVPKVIDFVVVALVLLGRHLISN